MVARPCRVAAGLGAASTRVWEGRSRWQLAVVLGASGQAAAEAVTGVTPAKEKGCGMGASEPGDDSGDVGKRRAGPGSCAAQARQG
ncbi:hypothetical protein [Oryza sativa Japonica Group]|uniref:Uncharacterized protein n=1 Tax=Oryza sativa subsp. japonica TaxID=39947 RepID=Q5JKL5_ORYSJ|nr:hypothetical protein [Oryza sativa Japonica Group]